MLVLCSNVVPMIDYLLSSVAEIDQELNCEVELSYYYYDSSTSQLSSWSISATDDQK